MSIPIRDGNNNLVYYGTQGSGTTGDPYVPQSPVLIGQTTDQPANTPTDTASLNGAIKGFWKTVNDANATTDINVYDSVPSTYIPTHTPPTGNPLTYVQIGKHGTQVRHPSAAGVHWMTVGTSANIIAFPVYTFGKFSIQVWNGGSVAINSFNVLTKVNPDPAAPYTTRISTASQYTSPSSNSILTFSLDVNGNAASPVNLAANQYITLDFSLNHLHVGVIAFSATVASGSTSLVFFWGVST